ncbi:GNAT family acetyltransferase [Paenibacillus pectinilyticus]|uniref:GNAT family acetyltransferase n=1 Tax=Paenibacillus pectinilyticus TaxID=512399 RepID=A0A1C0ZTE1_9BACL|nr:GNAT family N-acetyltransferase [Paenibacillus pectinilyticus]OCT11350.1 GNAT family acetyltransferase [Paenibacillus pectinilyticus]
MIHIETARLLLRDWQASDLEPFCRLNADAKVMRYFPKTLTTDETITFYEAIVSELKACGFGFYALEIKETQAFIGFIGFHKATFESDFTPCIEIGWRLKQEAWGKGYATEGAKACLQHGFTKLGLRDVYSFTADVNEPSKKVMMNIGMRFVKVFNHPKVEESSSLYKHVLYHSNRDSYKF